MAKWLYILVRTDMDSLGRGKGMAQASHISNKFVWDTMINPAINGQNMDNDALDWSREADGFGTAIVLAAPNLDHLKATVHIAGACGFQASMVVDPEYHLQDGSFHHIIPNVPVGAYVFGEKADVNAFLGNFKLMPNDPVSK